MSAGGCAGRGYAGRGRGAGIRRVAFRNGVVRTAVSEDPPPPIFRNCLFQAFRQASSSRRPSSGRPPPPPRSALPKEGVFRALPEREFHKRGRVGLRSRKSPFRDRKRSFGIPVKFPKEHKRKTQIQMVKEERGIEWRATCTPTTP